MRFSAKGLVIKEQKVAESDRLLTVLTGERGLIRSFAPHAMNIKSKNMSATQLLAYSDFVFYRGRDTYSVNEAQAINVFFDLRKDIEALSLAGYFCELAGAFAPQEDEAGDYLSLILNALHLLCKKTRGFRIIKSVVELRLCALSGYMPDLTACRGCGAFDDGMRFEMRDGAISCEKCEGNGTPVPKGVLAAMRHIIYSQPSKLFNFNLPDEALGLLSKTTERYVQTQMERRFSTLDFYYSVV